MKTTLRLLAVATLALSIAACSTPKKAASCGDGKCSACTASSHSVKKSGN